ncbi:hypothetical protein ACFO3O_16750 [Dokdonia ponticola]|uniref:Uncharacterized protein n=1 Tax=Dokdonia ponticola TaxID=2041041 RepID=A0ABV9I0C2_9FLAO
MGSQLVIRHAYPLGQSRLVAQTGGHPPVIVFFSDAFNSAPNFEIVFNIIKSFMMILKLRIIYL